MRPLEYRARPYSEVQLARIAAVEAAFPNPDALSLATRWALDAIGPQPRFQIFSSGLHIGEHIEKFKCADRAFAHFGLLTNPMIPKSGVGARNSKGGSPAAAKHAPASTSSAALKIAIR